ncbi:MAG: DUF2934 domain-containing protein [Bradyrhizobium sp.]|nr:DUF2934 domain-containing protein [Bradyrhizobium sp.]
MNDALESQIRVRAYRLWELAGMPEARKRGAGSKQGAN